MDALRLSPLPGAEYEFTNGYQYSFAAFDLPAVFSAFSLYSYGFTRDIFALETKTETLFKIKSLFIVKNHFQEESLLNEI